MPESTTKRAEARRVSGTELLNRGKRLRPRLVERQAEAERLRHLPETTMAEFHEAGISRACGASGRVHAVASRVTRLGGIGATGSSEV
jgi:hypothetical protein